MASAKYVQIKISDSSSPTFADTLVTVNLNATAAATLVDNIWDEPCAGHTTSDTSGNQVCDQAATDTTNIRGDISDLSDGSNPVWVVGQTIATGTCDSGSVSTCIDATLTQSSTDYWAKGMQIVFTGGTSNNQTSCVTGFTPATDTITFSPAVTDAVSTDDYTLVANGACSLLDQVVEDTGSTYTARCILAAVFATQAGDWSTSGQVATFQDPGGNENRVVGTIDGSTRTSLTVTCP